MHSMGDTFALERDLGARRPESAIIVGAGYVGREMAEAFTVRGLHVIQLQRGPEVLSTLDPELGALVRTELLSNGVDDDHHPYRQEPGGADLTGHRHGQPFERVADLVLVVVGVRPNTDLLAGAGAGLGAGGGGASTT